MEIDRTRVLRHFHARPGQPIPVAQIQFLIRLRSVFELCRLLVRQRIHLLDLGNDPQNFLGLALGFLFGQLFLIELDNFFDGERAGSQFLADGNQFFQNDGRPRNRLEHHQVPALHALGDGHLVLTLQQRDSSHLTQI